VQQEEEKGVEKDAEEVVKKTCKREAKQKEEVVIGAGHRHLVAAGPLGAEPRAT
jgi:hypothetical protein